MSYRLVVRPGAKRDILAVARWYETQRAGLGHELVAEIDATMTRIAQNPSQYRVVYRGARRAIVRRFPYVVFFGIEHEDVVVLCVIHLHRDPGEWKKRVGG